MQMQRLLTLLGSPWLPAALLLSIFLAGCGTPTIPISATEPETACIWDRPILASRNDTRETIQAVKEHNAAWRAICDPHGTGRLEPKPDTKKAPA